LTKVAFIDKMGRFLMHFAITNQTIYFYKEKF
jgi:hypothetical protein